MQVLLQLGNRFVRTWYFWAFVLLVIPNCTLNTHGWPCEENDPRPSCKEEPECKEGDKECPPCEGENCPPEPCEGPDCPPDPCEPPDPMCPPDPCPGPNCPPVEQFQMGSDPVTDKLMCEIREPVEKLVDSCATPADIANAMILGMPQGATALAASKDSTIALDWSDSAKAICGGGPLKVTFLGAGKFPDGSPVCINATQQIPMVYATPEKACRVKCQDLINAGNGFKPANVAQYCIDNTRVATNYSLADFANACSPGGTPIGNFPEPRRLPKPVKWIDLIGTAVGAAPEENSLIRTAPDTMPLPEFDAGAASEQIIKGGDAWVDFHVTTNNQGQMLGVRTSCDDPSVCPDTDPGRLDIHNAIEMHEIGNVYVQDGDPVVVSAASYGTYSAGERYRIHVVDNHDGTATISFSRYTGVCGAESCPQDFFYTSPYTPQYPLRVDATQRLQNATLANVTIVYIQQ